jgi:hypothetical protein
MSSSILYKFRSGTTFEALPLPGSAARVLDVKKAIVRQKKLDQGGALEFDLSLKDATTQQEYLDESEILPRGTRLIVQRLPAAKGQGFLARMARNPYGTYDPRTANQTATSSTTPYGAPSSTTATSAVPANFYTIDGRTQDQDDEEFVRPDAAEQELAALRAATDAARGTAGPSLGVARTSGGPAGRGPPPPAPTRVPRPNWNARPNADPELREQEKLGQPKKRATGIPRTFQAVQQQEEGLGLQTNAIGFEELKNRGGGLSELSSQNNLDYVLKVTATSIPDYLQCAICGGVVRDAMILPWDTEGRTTCETCIRDALTQNGFRDPLTGMEGVSPDDLIPNYALRKAADQFVKSVMEKMDEINKQQVEDDQPEVATDETIGGAVLEGESDEKGVLVSKKTTLTKKTVEDDPFGGDDDFGGDVFAVEPAENVVKEEAPKEPVKEEPTETEVATKPVKREVEPKAEEERENLTVATVQPPNVKVETQESPNEKPTDHSISHTTSPALEKSPSDRRESCRRRGPPVGYAMGPAGQSATATQARIDPRDASPRASRGRSGRHSGDNLEDGSRSVPPQDDVSLMILCCYDCSNRCCYWKDSWVGMSCVSFY